MQVLAENGILKDITDQVQPYLDQFIPGAFDPRVAEAVANAVAKAARETGVARL